FAGAAGGGAEGGGGLGSSSGGSGLGQAGRPARLDRGAGEGGGGFGSIGVRWQGVGGRPVRAALSHAPASTLYPPPSTICPLSLPSSPPATARPPADRRAGSRCAGGASQRASARGCSAGGRRARG